MHLHHTAKNSWHSFLFASITITYWQALLQQVRLQWHFQTYCVCPFNKLSLFFDFVKLFQWKSFGLCQANFNENPAFMWHPYLLYSSFSTLPLTAEHWASDYRWLPMVTPRPLVGTVTASPRFSIAQTRFRSSILHLYTWMPICPHLDLSKVILEHQLATDWRTSTAICKPKYFTVELIL